MTSKRKKSSQKLCAVRWVEEDSVGVVPVSCIQKKATAKVGAIAEFKYKKQFNMQVWQSTHPISTSSSLTHKKWKMKMKNFPLAPSIEDALI